jgi:formate/nitrite transporter
VSVRGAVPSLPDTIDPLKPQEVAARLECAGVQRGRSATRTLVLLGLLGGVYIGFGGALATLVLSDHSIGYGLGRLAAGVAFSLGLIMLILAGGELFTGNSLMVLAVASRRLSVASLMRNWVITYVANAVGAVALAIVIHQSGILDGGDVKTTATKIAESKAHLAASAAFTRGFLCNMLVCLAVWMSVAARSLEGKVIAIIFPISAFVALGLEHCIANFYLLPIGILNGANVSVIDAIRNLVFVTLGNIAGGCVLAVAYWFAYLDDGTTARGLAAASRPALRLIGSMQQAVASRAARILGSSALERMTPLDSTTRAHAPTEMDVH